MHLKKQDRRQRRSHKLAKHTRQGLWHPKSERDETSWRRILEQGTESDLTKFTRCLFIHKLLPLFQEARNECNHGSPYRRSQSKKDRKTFLKSVDLLGLALCYLRTSGKLQQLCTGFGLAPSSNYLWLD